MKKTAIVLALVIALTSALCGCNNGGTSSSTASAGDSSTTVSSKAEDSSSADAGLPQGDKELVDNWGEAYSPRMKGAAYRINVPRGYNGGAIVGGGLLENVHKDEPGYVVSQLTEGYEDIKELEDILPTCKELFYGTIRYAEDDEIAVKNQNITVDSTERVKVNEYEMCITKGKYTFDEKNTVVDISGEYPYVCYSTFLTTGAPVFWVCFDQSEDKNLSSQMDELALKMGKTLREYVPESEKD